MCATSLVAGSAAAASWTIIDLGPTVTGDMALNDNGWVVVGNQVWSPSAGGYVSTVVRSADGSLNNLRLRDINNSNLVLGTDGSLGAAHAFSWQNGTSSYLPERADYTGGFTSSATSLNDSGQIVGNTGDTALRWSPNGTGGYLMTTLGVDLGWTIGSGEAMSINSAGAGLMNQVYNSYRTGYSFGVGHTSIIPELPGYSPVGLAINDRYQVAGYGVYNCGGYSCNRPFVWQGPDVSWLPVTTVPGWPVTGEARGLNELGQVVGGAYYQGYDRRALLWTQAPGGSWAVTDLNTLLPAGSAFWKLGDALDINERGQILGLGSVSGDNNYAHVFLLTPVPEPATAALWLLGLAAMAAMAGVGRGRRSQRPPC
ncbi:MAG: PEP-CTERM sorting domain-containing protein [Rubrivivax sp.]|nr:PEP-CTERM sorting domain-containing protein [Rubrivivax sp.]MDP3085650.1 PEP-CTERM sorting domain-containing protein [Rubrivivax sp.]